MRIQHNIMAMGAYRNYTNNLSAMKKNLEKLSSGYKINRAGDDAAGLAISEKMRAQITGLETAQKNAKDGISLVQTAEGALTEVHDMLNRMVELATQSANGTYDNENDRYQLQKELDQLRDEINRIADSSNFNGIKLLDGSMDSDISSSAILKPTDIATEGAFKVVNDGQLVNKEPTAGVYEIDFEQLKLTNISDDANGTINVVFTLAEDVTATLEIGPQEEWSAEKIAQTLAEKMTDANQVTAADNNGEIKIGDISYKLSADGTKLRIEMLEPPKNENEIQSATFTGRFTAGVTYSGTKPSEVGESVVATNGGEMFQPRTVVDPVASATRAYGQASFKLTADMVRDGSALKIGDTTYVFAVGTNSKFKDYTGDANVIDLTDLSVDGDLNPLQLQIAGRRLSEAAANNKNFYVGDSVGITKKDTIISLTEKEGGVDYSVNNLAGKDGLAACNGATAKGDATVMNWKGLVTSGELQMPKGKSLTLQIGDTAESFNQLKVSIGDAHCSALGIADISIADQTSAQAAVDKIKAAINKVSDIRGTLGATQNRLDHTINNLSVMTENIQDAESTIRDTDVAEEMMAYTKNNILIQSAQAMLAQANQVPQGVLQLLQ